MKSLDDQDVLALRDACQARYEQLSELLRDSRIPLDAREVIKAKADATMRAWNHIPDHFEVK